MAPARRKRSSLSCDVGGLPADAMTISVLARLQLAARRHGYEIRLCNASRELVDLVAFVGLSEVLRVEPQG
jgi:anti-anti-sigma regulatory factor